MKLVLAAIVMTAFATPAQATLPIVSGSCGVLDEELSGTLPYLFTTAVYVIQCQFMPAALTPGGLVLLNDPNGGGGSTATTLMRANTRRTGTAAMSRAAPTPAESMSIAWSRASSARQSAWFL